MDDMLKKKAAKEALEELICEMMGLEAKGMDSESEPEESSMKEKIAEATGDMMEDEGSDMDESDMMEKMEYMQGAKKPSLKKSMTVMMKNASMKKPIVVKKKAKYV